MNSHKYHARVCHTLGLQRDTSGDNKEQELMQGMKESSEVAAAQVTKLSHSGLLVFLKDFGTRIFSA